MNSDSEYKSHSEFFNEFGGIDWNLINEALFDEEPGFSSEQSSTPTSTDQQRQFLDRKLSGDESKTKVTAKRKRDNLQEHIKALEEQNKIMRRALAEYRITPDQIVQKQNARLGIFKKLIEIFNSGDVLQLTNYLLNITGIECLLLTPSLFQELHGRNAVIQFWTLILEAFPDGLWQLSDTAYEENGFVATRFTFTGTKVAALPSDVLLHRWGKFREMMLKTTQGSTGNISGHGINSTISIHNNNSNNLNSGVSHESQAATFRELCTHDNVPTTSGPFIPRGQAQFDAPDLPETYEMESSSNYLPHHQQFNNLQQQQQQSNLQIPSVKNERFSSPESIPDYNTHTNTTTTTSSSSSSSSNNFNFPGPSIGSAAPLSAIMGCPTLKLTGYMTVTFNSQDRINRFIFVWNTASLIGQILGLSNGDLETMSQYFNTPNTTNTSST
mmetsp:Transcript_16331/g.17068  ORF Transcript_16331/g.17068 Transcript_16331/m.17068 type:complete len:442 (-) Transcript_16331:21-1346(-)